MMSKKIHIAMGKKIHIAMVTITTTDGYVRGGRHQHGGATGSGCAVPLSLAARVAPGDANFHGAGNHGPGL